MTRFVATLLPTPLALVWVVSRFIKLNLRSGHALAAENLFLRKQLALYLERNAEPARAHYATRLTLVFLARPLAWRKAKTIVSRTP